METPTEIEALYLRHGPALVLFARSIVGDRSRGQDVVHQVFLKLIEDGNLRRILDTKAYLFTSVRNAALTDAKAKQRNLAIDPENTWFEAPDRDLAAELALRRALSELPNDQREVTVLHVWGELTFSEIAGVLEISANTAASRYRYALASLRELMRPKEAPYGKP
jgi:RNA polymerase sigma-70 factor (ECF subfamily)